jgi:hypothetical protein
MDYATGRDSMFPSIGTNLPPGITELYVSHRAYWTRYAGSGGASFIFKWTRVGSNPSYTGIPRFYETIRPGNDGTVNGTDRGFVTDTGTIYAQQLTSGQNANTWSRTEYHYKLSTPAGSATGAFEQWVNSIQNVKLTNAVTRTAAESGATIDYVMFPFDGNDSYGASNGYYFWVDDYYVDSSVARVEVCTGSTWATRGDCEIQIPSAWSANAITIKANQGAIPAGAARYLYVVDPDGVASSSGRSVSF